jgi:FkbH-like protein
MMTTIDPPGHQDPALAAALRRLDRERVYGAYMAVGNALCRADDVTLPGLKITVLRNFTLEPLLPVLEGELALSGRHAILSLGGLETMVQDAHALPSSPVHAMADMVIIAAWLPGLSLRLSERFAALTEAMIAEEIEHVVATIKQTITGIRQHTAVPIIINNFPLPTYPAYGVSDAQSHVRHTQTILKLNQSLLDLCTVAPNVFLADYLSVFARVGSVAACDQRGWQIARAPLSARVLGELGRHYASIIRALLGLSRKVLVLDCDNTLWGGTVGDEGIHGIKIGESHPGSSYQAFQRAVLDLKDRGVVLALASKNNETDVFDVLRSHPGMLIREQHLAAWQIHWGDKVTSVRTLAKELNLSLDAFVFADDSAFECEFVREALPEVAVIHLKGDPSSFAAQLQEASLFDSLVTSNEDRLRTQMYRAEKQRAQLKTSTNTLEEYLTSLDLVAEFRKADRASLSRIAQLTQKTNQFNLTTRRYGESEINALMLNPASHVYAMRLRDRIDDLGIIAAAILRCVGDDVHIDTFLMSCRALGRGAEIAFLSQLIRDARQLGARRIHGEYRPTERNAQVADFYARHGFLTDANSKPGWSTRLTAVDLPPPSYIRILTEQERLPDDDC